MIDWLFSISTSVCVAITLLPCVNSDHWLFRCWEFPRLQIMLLILLNSLLLFVFKTDYYAFYLAAMIVCFAWQAHWVMPYIPGYPTEVPGAKAALSHTVKILTANVLMSNRNATHLVACIHQHRPDMILTLESDEWWQDQLHAIHDDYPYRVAVPQSNLYGMHLYSKLRLTDTQVAYLVESDIPSIHCHVEVDDSTVVHCHFLHPAPPSPTENTSAKPRDKELLCIARQVRPDLYPTIVTGDLNDVAWSPTTRAFRARSGLLDPRIGRGFFNTFHADYVCARWPLDHLFHSHHFHIIDIKRLEHIGSDHFPLLTELHLTQ
ncbi:endonuclease/exonuclease/phosphatase family protein [Pseudoalteromonas viridis]|uniref:Endonuclease/exonuclease/phosphatase family protein n=1 Tax=Pseudoalteromonas viridis TaxID=339617 RepID=A0ABX7V6A3_9GAMM|nr:endonuclease/exonuclease/phosphatase family protein [Pseudoalteromonas viridis]QTL36418.1 endonuclease/exonuclease/phosphatase family protein [Pseudoalteromonas viridis]